MASAHQVGTFPGGGHSLGQAAQLIDIPTGARGGDRIDQPAQLDDHILRHIVDFMDRLVERARQSLHDGKLNAFDQHTLNSFIPRRTATKPFLHQIRDETYKDI
ncbi:hypothetical protein B0T10DRAFT_236504 [Thelonectria olida]|uniref:Uncharacterized protein n=1 Tax=Thelonectria olida TaxID=1576542 RepID=A0A9P9AHU5_9HYPO|nr:hypothetical protein B0T10DRAFT_236504 [Thelonectria olida]